MNEFQFISANETYRNLYYQLPKVLFTSEFYKSMSNDSKIAYAMLQDRCEYSIQNNWIDQDGHIYFIFTRNELMEILGCKENKIAKIKKELKSKNLLYEKRIPPKKLPTGEFKNYPNRLYLGKLEVTATDVYALNKASHTNEFPESGKNQPSDKHDKVSVFFESGKNQRPEESTNTS
ncbi:replication initiator protein A, partial [Enterococcus faecalis]|nr:replication initiator protein A [Enterococcus faecalis]